MRKIFFFISLTCLFSHYFGQITTTINPTIAQLQQKLSGNGITITGLTKTCPTDAYALYGGGTGILSTLSSGILLTTGSAIDVSSNSFGLDTDNFAAGSALGDALDLSGSGSQDACYINFLITPTCNTLSVNYVFASSEYSDYVNGTFNDVFGFVITGPNPSGGNYNQTNIALVPGTSLPVSINNVNNGVGDSFFGIPPSGPCENCAYFQDAPAGIGYGGSTTVLTASTSVTPCQQYTMTIGVWDVGDGSVDSGVFLDVNGISCAGSPTINATISPSVICGPKTVTLTASGATATGSYTWAAPASGGLVTTTGTVVTANPTVTTTYTLLYSDANTCPGVPLIKSTTLTFSTSPSFSVTKNPSTAICVGQTFTLTANGGAGSYSWTPGTFLSTTSGSVVTSTPSITTTYSITKTTTLGCTSTTVTTVSVTPVPTIAITPSVSSICLGQSQALSSSGTGPFVWTASSGANPASAASVTVTPTSTTTYTVLSGTGACTTSAVATISISTTLTIAITPSVSSICLGQSVGLTSSGSGPFVWTASSGANPASAASVTVTPTSTTTYTVLSGTGSCTATAVAIVSISATPTINITPSNTTICVGENVELTSTGTGPFTWTASSGTTLASAATVTVSPSSTTTYSVLSGTGTCTASAVATVSISITPSIIITPSNTTICVGENVELTSTGTGPFTWTASSGANPASAATVTVSPTSTTTYTVLSGTGACTTTAVASISISTPSINITPSNTTICVGENIVLISTGTGPFTWTASSGVNPTSAATVTVSPTSITTYTVLSGTGSCTASAIATISISTTSPINITPSNTTICMGQSVTLISDGNGPFAWTASNGANPASTSNVNVTPTTSTTYTVLSGTGACTVTAIATVSVMPTLTLTITPGNTIICNGSGTMLTAGGATSYTWFPGLSTNASLSVSPTSTSNYSLIGTDGVCTNSTITTVNVITVSTSITPSYSFYCIGVDPVTLTANGATSYSWSPGTDLSSTNVAVVTASPSATIIYTVTGTTNGCIASQTVLITVPPISTITATTANSVICEGGSGTTLTASGANTYTWAPGSMTTSTINVNPVTFTSYTVTGKTTDDCIAVPAVITVSVLPAIDPTAIANSPTVCITNTVSINTTTVTGLTYTWQPISAIQGASNTSGIIAKPISTTTVIYTVTVSNGICTNSDTIQLQVLTPPTAINFITLNNDTVCVDGCVTFSSTTIGSQPKTYTWFYESGIGTSSVGISPEACYPSSGSFSVMLVTNNICGTDTLVKSNYIKVYDMPVLTVSNDTTIKIGESGEIFASGGLSYSWSPNNGTIVCASCSNTIVQPTLTTQYIVIASNSPYCKVQDTVNVIVDTNCGDFFIPNVFSPNDDGLNDVINIRGRCVYTFNLQIFNRWGEKVFETSSLSESWDGTFRGQKMDTGVFIYKVEGLSIDGQSFKLKGNITLLR